MIPPTKKSDAPQAPSNPDDVDFADEAGPKDSEFSTEKDAKEITAGEFDLIP